MNNPRLVHTPGQLFRFRFRSAAILIVLAAAATTLPAATVPTGFTHSQIGGNLNSPTAFAIAPDGRIFVCEQGGKLRVIKNGTLLPTPFVTLTVDSVGERGLLGVAFDPSFATNKYVYVYFTATSPTKHNRVSRFTANGDVVLSGSQVVLLDLDNLTSATNHNGGALHFGDDGKLYIAVGENATPSNAQSKANLLGKLLRINKDGTIPTDNPFYSTASGKNRAIWALGLRNPFTFAVQPGSGRIFINDVGQNTTEEVNEGVEGANYGWPSTEGPTSNAAYESPVYSYANSTSTCAITGGTFYNPPVVQFPSGYVGDYFFADYCGNWIRRLDAAGSYTSASTFATGVSKPVDVKVASDGSLYYIGRGSSSSGGGLYRIQYTQNTPPAITVHPQGKNVTVGDPVTFSVSASGTTPLSYQWQRNGANISGATAASFTIASAQNADDGDAFRCRVSNAYGNVMSNAAILGVTPSLAPVAGISSPLAGTTYSGGQTISYSGTGTDPEDGNLPASAFEWEIVLHHDTHTHPFLAPTTGSKSGSFIVPRTGHTEDNVWYRIHLTVTDSDGLSHSVFRDVIPRKTTMTFVTVPSGLQITLEGQPLTTPATVVGVEGIERTLGVISPQTKSGTTYTFASWSDGGAATHDILTPVSNTTFTATFSGGGPTPTPGPSGLIPTNGGFESGSTGPTGWTLETSATSGNWTWDSTTFAKGARSAKLTVAGTAAKRSPYLRSAEFELEPGKAYTFSVWTRTAGTGGSAPPAIRVVELDANGNTLLDAGGANIQHGIQAPLGTSGWTLRTLAIVTDPRCVRGKVTANIPNGYGTFWVDAVRID